MIPFSTEQKIHQVTVEKLSLKDFENWLYQDNELENSNPDLYFELISFDYSNEANFNAFYDKFSKYVDRYKFEVENIKDFLYSIIDRDKDCANAIVMTYELYCMGYEFFQKLGLMYGLCIIDTSFPVRTISNTNEIIDMFYPSIIEDAKNVLAWLEEGKIIIKEEKSDYGGFEYDDFRTEEERLMGQVVTTSFNDSK